MKKSKKIEEDKEEREELPTHQPSSKQIKVKRAKSSFIFKLKRD